MKYYVSASVYRSGDGSEKYPFKTIREAAKLAMPGDEVIVGAGTYHEYVDPENAGTPDARIIYRSEKALGSGHHGSGESYRLGAV